MNFTASLLHAGPAGSAFAFTSPVRGQTIRTAAAKISLRLGHDFDQHSLYVLLNGKDISSRFTSGNCGRGSCEETATVSSSDGLVNGANRLRASVTSNDSQPASAFDRVLFDYLDPALGAPAQLPNYLAPALGITANAGGSSPWITITTGMPAQLVDNIDTSQYSVPYRDVTLPTSNASCSNDNLQVLVLNRQIPVLQTDYQCFPDSASLKQYLTKRATGSLVVVGTTSNHYVPSGFDTSSIGGTDYSNAQTYPANKYPVGYIAIGVRGANAGSAFENYRVPQTGDMPWQYQPWFYGLLAIDSNSNYNFHAADARGFTVSPNDPTAGTSLVTIRYQNYKAPPSATNGFWLLILDRMLLQPIDSSQSAGAPCPYDGYNTAGCGTFYPTGSADSSTSSQAVSNLAAALARVNSRNLIFLVSVGKPFNTSSQVSNSLAVSILNLGGADYTLLNLTTSTSAYALVAAGPPSACSSGLPCRPAFTSDVVVSTTAYKQQGQTGFVRGIVSRNLDSLYAPAIASQEVQSGTANIGLDYSFHEIATSMPIDWPLTDTSGHIAAYHYASNAYLSYYYQETGSHSQDLRYFYPGRPTIGANNTYFKSNPVYPGDGHGFTSQDLTDVQVELYKELTALSGTNTYLGSGGIQGIVNGNAYGQVATDMIKAANDVLNGQVGATPNTSVSMSPSGWMNLIAGIASIPGIFLGPLDFPVAAAGAGVLSGLMWTGSAFQSIFDGPDATPPSYENVFDTTLGDLANNSSKYVGNISNAYAVSLGTC